MSGEAPGGPQGLPRALDVQRFAGAREQEIKALVSALKGSRLGAKFGVAALPRHLRRRAGSHKPFHRHAFRPNTKLQGKRRKLNSAAEEGDAAAEQAEAADAAAGEQQTGAAARPFTNRRMRRQPALLQQQHRESAAWTEACLEAGSAASSAAAASLAVEASGSGGNASSSLRRLETHVWHAKRLAMEERFGWVLPAGAAGQGRGSRSFVHVTKASALMHDASYLCPLLLSGPWHAVHGLLSALMDPAEAEALAADWEASFGSGSAGGSSAGGSSAGSGSSSVGWEQEVMLHRPGRYPLEAVCPAQLLLCPAVRSGDGSGGSGSMQACLWVHPAAASEAYAALQAAAQQAGSAASLSVLNVRRLELRGGTADTALAVALAGATASGIAPPNSGSHIRARSSRHQQHRQQGAQQAAGQAAAQQAQQQDALPPPPLPPPLLGLQHGEAVQLLLPDPRLCKPVALGSAAAGLLQPAAADEPQELDMLRLLQAPLPLSEAELSQRRQQLRQRMLHLEQPCGSSGQTGRGASAAQQEQQQRGQRELEQRGYCLAVLVRHDGPEAEALPGWSLIVPAGWVPPFWLAAAFAGCKPAGQREWRWLHTLQGRPCFPWDQPDTAGHAALMAQQQMQRQLALAKRPKAKQMLAAPASPPDWHDVLHLSRGGSKARLPSVRPAGQQQGAAAPAEQGRAAAGEQGPEQPATAMEVDATPGTSVEAAVAEAEAPSPAGQQQLFVARSYASMAAALHGGGSGRQVAEAVGLPIGRNPVTAGLQQGLLQWWPRQQPGDAAGDTAAAGGSSSPAGAGQPCCLVEAAVVPIKTGVAAEGAAVCFIAGREGERHRTPVDVLTARQQRRRQREAAEQQAALEEAGGSSAEAGTLAAAAGTAGSGRAEVGESEVRVIGYVSSEAPRGTPRRCGALAAVAAAPAWRLRALQHSSSQQGGGVIEAFIRNPGSASLFPVRLCLRLEPRLPL